MLNKSARVLLSIYLPGLFTTLCILLTYHVSFIFSILVILGIADTLARYKDYVRLSSKCITATEMRRARHSACQRNALVASSPRVLDIIHYYRILGYRWYHVLPDNTFSKKSPYLKINFYKTLLGLK